MQIGTELEKLKHLLDSGVLTESEFLLAKSKLLNSLGPENTTGNGVNQIGRAANRWVDLQWASSILGLVAVALIAIFFFIPLWNEFHEKRDAFQVEFDATKKKIENAQETMDTDSKKFDEEFDKKKREMEEFRKKNFPNKF